MSNYTYHGTSNLIALPGRSVQTFPSGLVRVDRTYACKAADAGRYRQQFAIGNPLPFDDGTPSIDQMSIFPEPQEDRGDDGFVRFSVSAYGRVNTTGTIQSFFEEGFADLIATSQLPPATQTNFSKIACVNEIAIASFVAPNTNEPINNLPRDIPLRVYVREGSPLVSRGSQLVPIESVYVPGEVSSPSPTFGSIATRTSVTIQNIIEDSPGTVFGAWKEVVYKLRASALVRITSFQG
jgi:hypothetical protein